MSKLICLGLAEFLCSSLLIAAGAQIPSKACLAPPAVLTSTEPNIFSEQQEEWLGDAMADMIERDYKLVQDPALNDYLSQITARLVAALPPTKVHFQVLLVDSSDVNGFSLAGGRIYLTRKLVANAKDEDEVASVIGHEMGHIVSHQFGIETTADLKRLLGVTSVGDKADVYAKFQRLADARMTDKHPGPSGDSDDKQNQADAVSVYVTAAAGYHPQAYAEFWDRMFFVDGKVGGRLSDFFHTTKPEEKRLRAILKLISALPPGCGATEVSTSPAFARWHALVVANQAVTLEAKFKPASEVVLDPPLRMDLEHLRFSRDGRYILAQDGNSISVLTRAPYQQLFRFDAQGALAAEFSPDSERIVFHTPGLHTEEWSVAGRKMLVSNEPISKQECLQSKLSPDGRTLFCVGTNTGPNGIKSRLDLTVLDTTTGGLVFQKRGIFTLSDDDLAVIAMAKRLSMAVEVVPASFSPDGNTFLIGLASDKIAFDLRTRAAIPLGKSLKTEFTGGYAFVGDDKVIGSVFHNYAATGTVVDHTGIFSFPEGKSLETFPFRAERFEAVAGGHYVIIDSSKDAGAAVADLNSGEMVLTSKTSAMDVWDDFSVYQNSYGGLVLHDIDKSAPDQALALPAATLGGGLLMVPSPDGTLLAISTRSRGGVWDLRTGKRVMLSRRFTSAAFTADNTLYAEFPKDGQQERAIAHFQFAPFALMPVPYKETEDTVLSEGMLQEWKRSGKKDATLIVHSVADDSVLWQRTFTGGDPANTDNLLPGETIFSFPMKTDFARDRVDAVTSLTAEAAAVKNNDAGRLIQVVDNSNGNILHEIVIEVPPTYEGVGGVNILGDNLYVSGEDNRTMVYSVTTGVQLRQLFGYVIALDAASNRICTVNRRDEAIVYDAEGKELGHFSMGSPLRFAAFQRSGKVHAGMLVVLTADQKVRTMDLPDSPQSSSAAP